MTDTSRVRYVWGEFVAHNQRLIYAIKNGMRCAIYTAYLRKPEDNVVKVYPRRLLVRGQLDKFDKMSLSVMQIENERK